MLNLLRRVEWAKLVGALVAIAVCVAAGLLLRHVHWPDVWEWLRPVRDWVGARAGATWEYRRPQVEAVWRWLNSWAGLFTLAGVAVVFQLAGVVLVVHDVRFAARRMAWMDHWFMELERRMAAQDPKQQAKEIARGPGGGGDEWAFFYELFTMYNRDFAYLEGATNILRDFHRLSPGPGAWWTAPWLGPALLLAGIVFGGAAGLLQIDSPR